MAPCINIWFVMNNVAFTAKKQTLMFKYTKKQGMLSLYAMAFSVTYKFQLKYSVYKMNPNVATYENSNNLTHLNRSHL